MRAAASAGAVRKEEELQARCTTKCPHLTSPAHARGWSTCSCSFWLRVSTPVQLLLISLAHFYLLLPLSCLSFQLCMSFATFLLSFFLLSSTPLSFTTLPPPLLHSAALRHFALASISLLFQQIQSICCINISSQSPPPPLPLPLLGGVALRKLCCKW